MKHSKRIIASILSITMLSNLLIPTLDATAETQFLDGNSKLTEEEATIYKDILFIFKDGDTILEKTYFQNKAIGVEEWIDVPLDEEFDTSNIEKVITIDVNGDKYIPFFVYMSDTHEQANQYGYLAFISNDEGYFIDNAEIIVSKKEPTIGESSTPSEETLKRGDVNGDGNVNVLDLLQLKKYILKIIDTLE